MRSAQSGRDKLASTRRTLDRLGNRGANGSRTGSWRLDRTLDASGDHLGNGRSLPSVSSEKITRSGNECPVYRDRRRRLDRLFAGSLVSLVGMANGTFKSWRSSARYAVAATLVDAGVYLRFLAGPGLDVLPLRLRVEAPPARESMGPVLLRNSLPGRDARDRLRAEPARSVLARSAR